MGGFHIVEPACTSPRTTAALAASPASLSASCRATCLQPQFAVDMQLPQNSSEVYEHFSQRGIQRVHLMFLVSWSFKNSSFWKIQTLKMSKQFLRQSLLFSFKGLRFGREHPQQSQLELRLSARRSQLHHFISCLILANSVPLGLSCLLVKQGECGLPCGQLLRWLSTWLTPKYQSKCSNY